MFNDTSHVLSKAIYHDINLGDGRRKREGTDKYTRSRWYGTVPKLTVWQPVYRDTMSDLLGRPQTFMRLTTAHLKKNWAPNLSV